MSEQMQTNATVAVGTDYCRYYRVIGWIWDIVDWPVTFLPDGYTFAKFQSFAKNVFICWLQSMAQLKNALWECNFTFGEISNIFIWKSQIFPITMHFVQFYNRNNFSLLEMSFINILGYIRVLLMATEISKSCFYCKTAKSAWLSEKMCFHTKKMKIFPNLKLHSK